MVLKIKIDGTACLLEGYAKKYCFVTEFSWKLKVFLVLVFLRLKNGTLINYLFHLFICNNLTANEITNTAILTINS